MISNYCPRREPLRNVLMLLPLLFLASLICACGSSITSGSSPTPTSTQGIKGIFHEYALPPSQFVPGTITAGPDGNLWFTEIMQNGSVQASKIERITPTGTLSEFPLPSANTSATNIITGPDGNLWFIEGDKIARITPMGKISEFPLPSANTFPSGIATGPDGNLWFTEQQGKIGRMTLTGKVSEFSLPSISTRQVLIQQKSQLALPRANLLPSQQDRMVIFGSLKLDMPGPPLGASPHQA